MKFHIVNKIFLITSVAAAIAIGVSAFFSLSVMQSSLESQDDDDTDKANEKFDLTIPGAKAVYNTKTKLGGDEARIRIVEFGDYQCEGCYNWFQNTKPIIAEKYFDTGKVDFVFFDFPFLGVDSVEAANASWCAQEQDMYWEYHDKLYNSQRDVDDGWANPSNLKSYASEFGLDMEKFSECIDEGKYVERVNFFKEIGFENCVDETPTFFIIGPDRNTQRIDGAQPFEVFQNIISQMEATQ